MKNNLLIILFIFTLGLNVQAEKKPRKKWKDVHKLLLEEKKTIRRLGARGIIYKHRIFEIDNELMKIIKDKEHKRFFALAKEGKLKGSKESYYQNSKKLYYNNKRLGLELIKRYPNYERIAEIYFSLALNERDYNQSKDSEYFLQSARRTNKNRNERLKYKIYVELSEYYYNKKEYSLAAKYYKDVIKNKDDKWHTKHLYNYAWCIFKQKEYARSIELLNLALDLGKKPEYLEVTEQIYEAAVSFYVFSKNILPGINFFKKNKGNEYYWLHKFSKKAAEKGFYQESLKVMAEALKFANDEQKNELFLSKVIIARNNKDMKQYDATIKELEQRSASLKKEEREQLVAEVLNFAGLMQRKLRQSHNKVTGKFSEPILNKTLGYFETLIKVDQAKKDEYRYFQGETLFGVNEFARASKYYLSGLKTNLKKKSDKKDKELQEKLFNSMFSLLTSPDIPKKQRDKYAFYTYGQYLTVHPNDNKSMKVYRALFDLSVEYKKFNYGFNTLTSFVKNHRSLISEHKKMFFYLFDQGIQSKKPDFLAGLVTKMDGLKLGISKFEKETAIQNLGSLVFHEIESKENKAKTNELIADYSKLYNNKLYPATIRANSSLKLAHFLADNFRTEESYDWVEKSINLYSDKEKKSRMEVYNNFSYLFVELQDFESSMKMINLYTSKFCSEPNNKLNELVILKMNVSQVLGNELGFYKNLRKLYSCGLKVEKAHEMKKVIVSSLMDTMKIEKLYDLVSENNDAIDNNVVNYFYQNYWRDIAKSTSYKALQKMSKVNSLAFKKIGQIVEYKKMLSKLEKAKFTNLSEVITKDNFESKLAEYIGKSIESSALLINDVTSKIVNFHDVAKVNLLKSLHLKLNENIAIFDAFKIEELDSETMKIVKGEVDAVAKDLRVQSESIAQKVGSIKSTSVEAVSKVDNLKLYKADMNQGVSI